MNQLPLMYFTDILCVWAYAGQVRIDRIVEEQGEHLILDTRFCSIFANGRTGLEKRWAERGGLAAYADHIRSVCEGFEHVDVHDKVWRSVTPNSSLNAHIFLSGIRHLEREGAVDVGTFRSACWQFREAFFRGGRDIGTRQVHYEVAEQMGLPLGPLEQCLGDGSAHAELSRDFELAREHDVRMSPTIVLNEGRQRLSGNLGYRVIAANVRELLRDISAGDASWC